MVKVVIKLRFYDVRRIISEKVTPDMKLFGK